MNGYENATATVVVVRGEESAPEISVTKSARFNQLA